MQPNILPGAEHHFPVRSVQSSGMERKPVVLADVD